MKEQEIITQYAYRDTVPTLTHRAPIAKAFPTFTSSVESLTTSLLPLLANAAGHFSLNHNKENKLIFTYNTID